MDLGVVIGAALTCVAGGFFPWINGELVVGAASLLIPPVFWPVMVVLCAAGQMSAKCVIYGVTRWAPDKLPPRAQRLIAKADKFGAHRRLMALAVFTGALVAIPPFYIVTLACGMLRVRFALFALVGFAGTAGRYGLVVWAAAALGIGQ